MPSEHWRSPACHGNGSLTERAYLTDSGRVALVLSNGMIELVQGFFCLFVLFLSCFGNGDQCNPPVSRVCSCLTHPGGY